MPHITLGSLIKMRKLTQIIERVRVYPKETYVQIKTNFKCGTIVTQILPIHRACARNTPLDVILALLAADPETAKKKDGAGRLPLHYAIRYGAGFKIIHALISVYPESVRLPTIDGSLPIHLACAYGDSETMPLVSSLLRTFPESIRESDGHGLLPRDCACHNPNKEYITDIIDLIDNMLETDKEILSMEDSFSLDRCHTQCIMSDNLLPRISSDEYSRTSNKTHRNNRSKYRVCVVCMDKEVSHVLIPCGHPCLCADFSTDYGLSRMKWRCPECRENIREVTKFFGRIVDE